jgi:drug/metabolite transporter (DMT)-like permease
MLSVLATWQVPPRETIGELQIIFSVVVFGVSFVLARFAMIDNKIGPITFTACRFLVSTILLYMFRPCAQKLIHSAVEKSEANIHNDSESFSFKSDNMQLWLWGTICGTSNLTASILLQIGLMTVTAGKAGFITGMYVVFIPVVEYYLPGYGVHLTWKSWVAAIVCIIGLFFISGCAEQDMCGAIGSGELLVLGSMLCWIVNIMIGDIGAKNLDVFSFTLVDFFMCSVVALLLSFYFEPQEWVYPFRSITGNWVIIAIIGFTEALAFPMSTMGQMYVSPARASLLMSLESLTCALGGFLFLHEYLTGIEMLGCLLMFAATLISTSNNNNPEDGTESDDGSELYEDDSVVSDQHSPLYASEKESPLGRNQDGGRGGKIGKFFFGSFTFSGKHSHRTSVLHPPNSVDSSGGGGGSSPLGALEMLAVSSGHSSIQKNIVTHSHDPNQHSDQHTDRLISDHRRSNRSRQNSSTSIMSDVNHPVVHSSYGSVVSAGISGVVHNVGHMHIHHNDLNV